MTAHHRPPLRLRTLLAALALALALGACQTSPAPQQSPSAAATEPAPIAERTTPPPQTLPTAEAPPATEEPPEESPEPGTASAGAVSEEPLTATKISAAWPDLTWTIFEDFDGDACAGSPPEISRWALGEDYFTCGDPEDGLLACRNDVADLAFCVRDPLEKTAVFIRSPEIEGFTAPAPEDPLPLMVVLADGTTCSSTLRDDVEHHAGRQSWMYCGEESALLLDLATASEYFDPSAPVWTAELGVGRAAPVEVEVREVIYAGRPDDAAVQALTTG